MKNKLYTISLLLVLLLQTGCSKVKEKVLSSLFSAKYKEVAVNACKRAYLRDYTKLQHDYLGVVNAKILLNINQKVYFGFDSFKLPEYDKYDLEQDYRDEMCTIKYIKKLKSGVYTVDIGSWTEMIVFDKDDEIRVQFDPDDFIEYLYTKNVKPIVKSKEKTLALATKKANKAFSSGEDYETVRLYKKAVEFYILSYEAAPSKKTAQKIAGCYTKIQDTKNAQKWLTLSMDI